eukprot:TRINITY_DN3526_c0_g1_i17.p1 TRINITY_DN3526_c0_g1~~TRINITY_DN3526_c0_g1_i17.p1  ORF type:complete len:221 (-),score=60.72 TRINITY_DN3526_c0_g1_i17:460-1122(-)
MTGLKVPTGSLQGKQQQKVIYQYHFQSWPDMGVPNPTALLEMMSEIEEKRKQFESSSFTSCDFSYKVGGEDDAVGSETNDEQEFNCLGISGTSLIIQGDSVDCCCGMYEGKVEELQMVEEEVEEGCSRSPLLVHCSAGVGRTGTFCLIHSLLCEFQEDGRENLEEKLDHLSLQPLLTIMRNQRPGFIQQQCQYLFCYRAVRLALLGEDHGEKEEKKKKKG